MKNMKFPQFEKYIILPFCLLSLNAIEEIVVYKSESISNPYMRVLTLLILFTVGISFVAFIFSPLLSKVLKSIHQISKKEEGVIGEVTLVFCLWLILFFVYFAIYIMGPETLLPPLMQN